VPTTVAPNVLTLMSFVCVLQAYWLADTHGIDFPKLTSVAGAGLSYASFTLAALAGLHARNTRTDSQLGELLQFGCRIFVAVFLTWTLMNIVGITDPATRWYFVQGGQFIFLSVHLKAFNSGSRTLYCRRFLVGSGEVAHACILVMLVKAAIGYSWAWDWYLRSLHLLETVVPLDRPPFVGGGLPGQVLQYAAGNAYKDGVINPDAFFAKGVQVWYYIVWWGLVVQVMMMKREHWRSRNGLCWCLLMRVVPAIVMEWTNRWDTMGGVTPEQTISDGLFVSMLTSDIIVAKMAGREFHNIVVLM
jgi:hypothetical protein